VQKEDNIPKKVLKNKNQKKYLEIRFKNQTFATPNSEREK